MDRLVIPDGNRRWASERECGYDFGYRQLPRKIATIIDTLKAEGICKLYFWCNSPRNLLRPKEQVRSFFTHYADIFKHVSDPEGLRVHIKGNRTLFPE